MSDVAPRSGWGYTADDDPAEIARLVKKLRGALREAPRSLEDGTTLAYLLHVKDDARVEPLLDRLCQIEFQGDFNVWSPVERAVALRAFRSDADLKHQLRDRLLAAGVDRSRRRGQILGWRREEVQQADADGERRPRIEWRLLYLQELVFLIVVAKNMKLIPEYEENLRVLQGLLGVG